MLSPAADHQCPTYGVSRQMVFVFKCNRILDITCWTKSDNSVTTLAGSSNLPSEVFQSGYHAWPINICEVTSSVLYRTSRAKHDTLYLQTLHTHTRTHTHTQTHTQNSLSNHIRNAPAQETKLKSHSNHEILLPNLYHHIKIGTYLISPTRVGISTRYGLDGPGIESRWKRDFPQPSRLSLRLTQSPIQRVSDHFRAWH